MASLLSPRGVEGDPSEEASQGSGVSVRAAVAAFALSFFGALEAAGQEPTVAMKDVRQRIDELLKNMDGPTFIMRQNATKDAKNDVWEHFSNDPEKASIYLQTMKERMPGKSREQRERVKSVEETLLKWKQNTGWALPKGTMLDGDGALRTIGEQGRTTITIDPQRAPLLRLQHVDLTGERGTRMTNRILSRLCEATGTVPDINNDGSTTLVIREPGARTIANDELLYIVEHDASAKARKLTPYMEPGRGVLFALADSNDQYGQCGMCMPQETYPKGTPRIAVPPLQLLRFKPQCGAHIYEEIGMPPSNEFHAVVGDTRITKQIIVGEAAEPLGMQSISMRTEGITEDGRWIVICSSQIDTSTWREWDPDNNSISLIERKLLATNRYDMRDADDRPLKAWPEKTDYEGGSSIVRYYCSGRPTSATVTAYSRVAERRFTIPPLSSPPLPPR